MFSNDRWVMGGLECVCVVEKAYLEGIVLLRVVEMNTPGSPGYTPLPSTFISGSLGRT